MTEMPLYRRLKSLSRRELSLLASELRRIITETVARNGGHLSSNLGTVELTIALYRVFDPGRDVIVWDTGHQAYTHKLLTGRYERFHTLRQSGGISGFLRRTESVYDSFGAGHVGTSIGAALGIEQSLDRNDGRSVVAVIGDGAMTAGSSLEALNQLENLRSSIKIVLNDNGMSIGKNVGGMASILSELRLKRLYRSIKADVKDTLETMKLGSVESLLSKLKNGIKQTILGANLFEDLGLNYIGPIDGHNLKELEDVFSAVKDFEEPFLIHVATTKGYGVDFAERDAPSFHSVGAFDSATGMLGKPQKLSYSTVFGEVMRNLAAQDSRIHVITAAMPDGTGLGRLQEDYPQRTHDLGITEQLCTTFAAGMATCGKKPVFAVYSTFLQRAFDQVIHDICLQNLPVMICVDRAGIVGEDGPTHHGIFDIAFLSMIPNMQIFCPSSLQDLADTLYSMLLCNELNGPVAVRYPKKSEDAELESVISMMKCVNVKRWRAIKEAGNVAVLATGSMVEPALKIANEEDIGLFDCRITKPLDLSSITRIAANYDAVVTVEEGIIHGGFGSAVLRALNELGYRGVVKNLGIDDHFSEHGSRDELLSQLALDYQGLRSQIRKIRGELCAHNHRIRED